MRHLKNFGLTKKSLDACILPQAKEAVQYLEENSDKNGEICMSSEIFNVPVLNVIWHMITGVSLDRENCEMKKLLFGLNFIFSSKIFILATIFPWMRYFFPSLSGYNRRLQVIKDTKSMLRKVVYEHEESLNKQLPRDLIDAFLIERDETQNIEFSEEQLIMTCFDLMAAGAETTSTTLLWIIEYLVLYPDVQEKCYQEIVNKIGNTDVSLETSESLHYCQATIAEAQRLGSVATTSIMHRLTQQVDVGGFILPKDTLFISNLKLFMMDPQLWTDPEKFLPERFLDENKKFFRPEHFVPLGHGKRVCMGESLARAELSIFFVTLLQHIKFSAVPGKIPKVEDYLAGFTRIPYQFTVAINPR